jgi:PAS domain S-box-containing protein
MAARIKKNLFWFALLSLQLIIFSYYLLPQTVDIANTGHTTEYNTDYNDIERKLAQATGAESIKLLGVLARMHMKNAMEKKQNGRFRDALAQLKRAQAIASLAGLKKLHLEAHRELAEVYTALKDYATALKYYKTFKLLNDSIHQVENNQKVRELEAQFNLEKVNKKLQLLQKEKKIQTLALNSQRNQKNLFIVMSVLILILVFAGYAGYRVKVKANRALSQEIEDHKHTAVRLRESEEKFRILAEKSVVGIAIIQDNTFKYVNPRYLSIFGYDNLKGEIINRNHLIHVAEPDRPLVQNNLDNLMSGATDTVIFEFNSRNRDGKRLHLLSYSSLIYYEERPAVLITLTNVTNRKKAEAELLKSQKLEAVGILAAGIAHDFNNLLTIISVNIFISKKKLKRDKESLQMVETVEKAAKQVGDLANKLIAFSTDGWIMAERLDVAELLQSTAVFHPEVMPLTHNVHLAPDLHPIKGDERQLRESIYNLLKNADEAVFSIPNQERHVAFKAENVFMDDVNEYDLPENDYVKITISDNGKGISQDHLEKVFDPYFSTKSSNSGKGMGLGLSICQSVIKKHNGHISIYSENGRGTSVDLYLPAYKDS